jgi:hypothetical protein
MVIEKSINFLKSSKTSKLKEIKEFPWEIKGSFRGKKSLKRSNSKKSRKIKENSSGNKGVFACKSCEV